jgi:hypothetical protein
VVLLVEQLNDKPLELLIVADGAVLFNVVVDEVEAVHPLLPVTVTVNVPAVVAEMVAVVAPVLHK